ncbi:hypothetical protein [Clostridium chauvoei]|uniref:Uncharacterized protein n=2 Tax=Clostridium chauvoei TaxID=46867 RepID=S6EMQ2_9CLOT|nr:hypothetical protein [Clostridium chauvoei]ATD55983.1 hypothetical protein BTM20_12530 [Clostridium chauvoei]ATD56347.1 hypothetical protein BTM21_00485 [Clostridium chauvoei]MBX7280881.1 hypothetical protein [Clostridium chauvoei]MBX7283364.1 hypothetical protein [Clostridium chauvoei]MBX7285953.1 hypothetical protein [Clostridium chauvoei]
MGRIRLKDVFTFICTLAVVITSGIIICTFLTIYQFFIIGQIFNSYFLLQLAISITMALWSIRFFIYRKGKERYIYSGAFMLISIIFIFFMSNLIK